MYYQKLGNVGSVRTGIVERLIDQRALVRWDDTARVAIVPVSELVVLKNEESVRRDRIWDGES
jgi:hypothetical protein